MSVGALAAERSGDAPLEDTFDGLFRQLSEWMEIQPSGKPLGEDRVPVGSIRLAPVLFAARSSGRKGDLGGDQGHAEALERALLAKPEGEREFEPLTVFEVAGEDYCVDGHHRLAVYRRVLGAAATVPVFRIAGTLGDAVAASVRANSATFLPMNRAERQEAAWKLVKIGQGSKREQAALSGMGESFIAKLRRLKRSLEGNHPGEDWGSLWEAERLSRGDDGPSGEWTDEMEAAEIAEYVKRLRKAFGTKPHKRLPAIVAALSEIVGSAALTLAVREVVGGTDPFEWEDIDDSSDDF